MCRSARFPDVCVIARDQSIGAIRAPVHARIRKPSEDGDARFEAWLSHLPPGTQPTLNSTRRSDGNSRRNSRCERYQGSNQFPTIADTRLPPFESETQIEHWYQHHGNGEGAPTMQSHTDDKGEDD